MRRILTALAIVTVLVLTTGTAMAHDHWAHHGYYYPGYYAYRPAVVAVAPTYVAPPAVYPAPVVVAPAPTCVAPVPAPHYAPYAPAVHSSLYVGGRRFGIGVGF